MKMFVKVISSMSHLTEVIGNMRVSVELELQMNYHDKPDGLLSSDLPKTPFCLFTYEVSWQKKIF